MPQIPGGLFHGPVQSFRVQGMLRPFPPREAAHFRGDREPRQEVAGHSCQNRYQCLLATAYANVDCAISTVLSAPFISETTDPRWMRRLINRCESRGVTVTVVWIQCDLDTMHEYISFRSAAQDSWKLQN
ncbi:hypothetical protein ACFWPV_18820 [Streptomyces uncialis]|uniref:hypothetical protein n=1 Tax=Streptomyces uncialis TaxID=1048205 RepID=UPI003649D838